ncbi:TyeA family type III secretion system gatekeeper subunit [Salmonella enterica]|nr:TyeA family type III secretion system gatekeeper subunit [Salmonella enterica]
MIDNINSIQNVNINTESIENQFQQNNQRNANNSSPLLNLQNELAMISSSSLSETIEGLSLGYRKGSARKEDEGGTIDDKLNDILDLIKLSDTDKLKELSLQNSNLMDRHDPQLAMFGSMPKGEIIALISSLLQSTIIKNELKRKYAKLLLELLGEEQWELALLAWLGIGELNYEKIQKIKKLYEKAKDEDLQSDTSLLTWFLEVKDYPDRERYLKVIMRALSFDLSYMTELEDKIRTSAIVSDICRVILFISLDNYADLIAISIKNDKNLILTEVLSIIEQVWLTEEWLIDSPSRVFVVEEKQIYYFHLLNNFFQTLPDACFIDGDQKENIISIIIKIIDDKEDVN